MMSEAGRLDNLRRAIDTIEQKISQQSAPSSMDTTTDLALIQQQLNQMSGSMGSGAGSHPSSVSSLGSTMAQASVAGRSAAEAQVQQKKVLDTLLSQFGAVKSELASLKKDIARPVTVQKSLPEDEVKRIAAALHQMQSAKKPDGREFAKLSSQLGQLKEGLSEDLKREMSSTRDIAARIDSLANGMQALSTGVDVMSAQSVNSSSAQVDELAAQLDAMRMTIDDLPQTLAISRLEDRLNEITGQLDRIPDTLSQIPDTIRDLPNRIAAPEPADLSSLEGRLDEIARALVAVSNLNREPAKVDLSPIERMEERIGQLTSSVEQMSDLRLSALENDHVQALGRRIEGLTERLGSFEKYAANGDLGGASTMFASPDTGLIEDQLRQLTQRLDEATATTSSAAQISKLEAQIGQILRQISKAPATPPVDFSPVEMRLGQIEQQLAGHQQFALDAAHQAAQQAISMLGPQDESAKAIGALTEELKVLQQSTAAGSGATDSNTAAIESTLSQIVDRLGTIESRIDSQPASIAPEASAMQIPQAALIDEPNVPVLPDPAEQTARETPQSAAPMGQMVPPPLDPAAQFEAATQQAIPENHQPIEPGAQPPDVNKMLADATHALEEAHASLGSGVASHSSQIGENIGTDPVGAARRALQATTAEMGQFSGDFAAQSGEEAQKSKKPALPSLSGSSLRKPIIIAAAAALLFALAAFGYKKFMTGSEDVVVGNSTPVIEQSVEGDNSELSDDTSVQISNDTTGDEITASEPVLTEEPETEVVMSGDDANAAQISGLSETATDQPRQVDEVPAETNQTDAAEEPANNAPQPVPVEAVYEVNQAIQPAALADAARGGDSKALFEVGMRYSDGKNVKRDMVEAARWFERSAEAGFAPAQYSIGSLYEKGIGVTKNLRVASNWYEKAAAQGNARAMHNLAVIHAMGSIGEPDMQRAVQQFTRAADYGIKDSQFNLGILFGQGMGVPQNLEKSYKWFSIAARSGDADAAAKRDEVAATMDPGSLASAKQSVATWTQKKLDEEVNRVSLPPEWKASAVQSSAALTDKQMVRQAQVLLNERGFDVGTPDGLIGPKTTNAIREFQRGAGLPQTGNIDPALLKALGS